MRKQYRVIFFHFLHSRPFSFQFMFVLGILLTVLVSMLLNSGAVYASSSAPNIICNQWNYVSSPSPGTGDTLYGVAAISSTDVWYVGDTYNSNNTLTLAEHYNGTQWTVASTPTPSGASGATLSGVAAISTNDVWAVGSYWFSNYSTYTLIEHWNGTSWQIVPSPNPGSGQDAFLNSVAKISSTDVWAVGVSDAGTVVEQWNGNTWNVVPSPNPSLNSYLNSVAAVSASYVWAVGYYYNSNGYIQSLIEQWNGNTWNVVPSPILGSGQNNSLTGVAAVSATHVWAVGYSYPTNASRFSPQSGGGGPSNTLIEKWNGTSWKVVSSPNPSSVSGLTGIATISNKNIWAVGSYQNTTNTTYYSLIEHWNGTQWSSVPASKPGSYNSRLSAVASIPSSPSLWAVGVRSTGTTLTEYYC